MNERGKNYQTFDSNQHFRSSSQFDTEDGLVDFTHSNKRYTSFSQSKNDAEKLLQSERKHGLTVFQAAVFVAGEMAGSGVLALPKAIVDTGWIGLILLVILCFNAGFGGTCLGACWDIIEERYPEHRGRTRNPYPTIAYRVLGRWGSLLVSGCIQFTLFGAGTVYLLLSSQIIQDLFEDIIPNMSFCWWFLIISIVLTPLVWLGSPKDFSFVGIGALLTTALSCVLIFTQIIMDGLNATQPVKHDVHSFTDFFLAFGIILFAFGGASTFPTIQNDMINKKHFSKSVVIAFLVILALYLPVSAGGYFAYGENVDPNIIMSLTRSSLVMLANLLMAIHLILAFIIVINPVCQELEEIFQTPHEFGLKRCILRSGMICVMLFIGETIPKFGKILALVGGSTITLLTFVFPPLFYMKLCKQEDTSWPRRSVSLHVQVYLWELIIIGLIGGSVATYSAILSIFGHNSMTVPCYWSS